MNKTLGLFRAGFQTSTGKTPEFKKFARTFKAEFTKELESIGATKIVFSVGHFYISGFYTLDSQAWYFSQSDVRFFRDERIMYRKAENYQDFTGGRNQHVNIESGMAKNLERI